MPKYRKKPVVIEAFRIGIDPIPDWAVDAITKHRMVIMHSLGPAGRKQTSCNIATLEGILKANHGDYIIQGTDGGLYFANPEIFENTYDPEP